MWTDDHVLPSHLSARGRMPCGYDEKPTAMHARVVEHDTPNSAAAWAPGGVAGVSMRQRLPFQVSTSAWLAVPTAVHAAATVHDTAHNALEPVPVGRGVCSTRQPVPFHASLRGRWTAALRAWLPTAIHARGVAHETPASEYEVPAGG